MTDFEKGFLAGFRLATQGQEFGLQPKLMYDYTDAQIWDLIKPFLPPQVEPMPPKQVEQPRQYEKPKKR